MDGVGVGEGKVGEEGVEAVGDGREVDGSPGCGVVTAGVIDVGGAEVGGGEGIGEREGRGVVYGEDGGEGGAWGPEVAASEEAGGVNDSRLVFLRTVSGG